MESITTTDDSEYFYFDTIDHELLFAKLDYASTENDSPNFTLDIYSDDDTLIISLMNIVIDNEDAEGDEMFLDMHISDDRLSEILNDVINLPD